MVGGASGLGAAAAKMLAGAGARVVIVDINEGPGHALVADLGAAARFVRADAADAGEMEAAIREAPDLAIAINCAGIAPPRRVLSKEGPAPLAWFEKVIRVNLVGTFNVVRLAAAAMAPNPPNEEGERGVIVNTASIAAFEGQIGQVAYAASKGGIVGMTLPLARDLARHGVRVMAIAPGIFDTPLLGDLPPDVRATLGGSAPFPARLGRPEEYAQLARHIIENAMLNGEVIRLDAALRMPPK